MRKRKVIVVAVELENKSRMYKVKRTTSGVLLGQPKFNEWICSKIFMNITIYLYL